MCGIAMPCNGREKQRKIAKDTGQIISHLNEKLGVYRHVTGLFFEGMKRNRRTKIAIATYIWSSANRIPENVNGIQNTNKNERKKLNQCNFAGQFQMLKTSGDHVLFFVKA